MSQRPRIYTPQEVNLILPKVQSIFPNLRKLREGIISQQNQCDVEEITSHGLTGQMAEEARERMCTHKKDLKKMEKEFEKEIRFFEQIGCELKSLEPGLVDFYGERQGELIYLCWREDESSVDWWHSLSGGFSGRQLLT